MGLTTLDNIMNHQEVDPILGLLVSNVFPSRPKIRFVGWAIAPS
jgi:hypothetical protein